MSWRGKEAAEWKLCQGLLEFHAPKQIGLEPHGYLLELKTSLECRDLINHLPSLQPRNKATTQSDKIFGDACRDNGHNAELPE